ncbi:hypothetical protein BDW22DRAFT_1433386 [Trametopsis cervina]|nr:hypothetical protein BDW22DRAFT_1433386 [Trametopsis cervina]
MDDPEDSIQFLINRAEADVQSQCRTALENPGDENATKGAIDEIVKSLNTYTLVSGNKASDVVTTHAFNVIAKIAMQWEASSWVGEIRTLLRDKWDYNWVIVQPELEPADNVSVTEEEVSSSEARVKRNAKTRRTKRSKGKRVVTPARTSRRLRAKSVNSNENDGTARLPERGENNARETIPQAPRARSANNSPSPTDAGPAFTIEGLVGGMLSAGFAVPFALAESRAAADGSSENTTPLDGGRTLRSVRRLLADLEHDIAVMQWQARNLRALESSLLGPAVNVNGA